MQKQFQVSFVFDEVESEANFLKKFGMRTRWVLFETGISDNGEQSDPRRATSW